MFTSFSSGGTTANYPAYFEQVDPSDYGVVMDGETDNATALIAMRDYMLADTSKLYYVQFGTGTCLYSNNRWLLGVNKVVIDAYGVTFQNVLDDAWEINGKPLTNHHPFMTLGDVARTGANLGYITGDLFSTAQVNDTYIDMVTEGDAANYTEGSRVLIHGYNQQFSGSPPNVRFFEYKIIDTIVAGRITFTEPLAYFYDDRWVDDTYPTQEPYGKPRILNLERGNILDDPDNYHFPEYIKIKGCTFLANPDHPTFVAPSLCAHTYILEDVEAESLSPTCCRVITYSRVTSTVNLEIDKVIDNMSIYDSDITGPPPGHPIGQATSVNNLTIENCRIYGTSHPQPRVVNWINNDLYSNTDTVYGIIYVATGWPINYFTVTNNRFHNLSTSPLLHCVNTGVMNKNQDDYNITVDSVGVDDEMLIPWDAHAKQITNSIDYGFTFYYADTSTPVGTVTEIYHDGGSPGNLVINGTWTGINIGEEYMFRPIEHIIDGGNNTIIGDQVDMWRNPEWLD